MDRVRLPSRQRATLVNARSRETRASLTRAALRLWSEGDFDEAFEATTTADIARAAGVSKGTFYFHFSNKEAILLEMSSATIQAMIDQVEDGTRRGVPLGTLSDQVLTSTAKRVVRGPRAAAFRAAGLGFSARSEEGAMAGPRLNVAFEALLRHGLKQNEVSEQADLSEGAAMLTAVTMEAIIRWGAGDRSASWLGPALCERAAVILRGMSPPG